MYRTGLLAFSVAVFGVALGMTLPDNRIVFFTLLGVAACCVIAVIVRDEAHAPLHGLHRVVRLPVHRSVATTGASYWSRGVGSVRSLRAAFGTRRPPAPIVLDEPDDEAAAWWGPSTIAATPSFPALAETPEAPEASYASLAIAPLEPEAPVPVLAAPIPTAHVPADPSVTVKLRVSLRMAAARRHLEPIARKVKPRRHREDTPASIST